VISSNRSIVIYCGVLLALGAFSVDVTLPVFDLMATDLKTPVAPFGMTVTIFVASLGVGQLVYGPLSDRVGRRPTLVLGFLFYIGGAITATQANSLDVLLIGRSVQGFGAAAALVVARVILRDLYDGPELARQMALTMAVFSFAPVLAPLIGFCVVNAGGSWRLLFVAMAGYAIVLLALLWSFPETLAKPQSDALHPKRIFSNLKRVLMHRDSRYFIAVNSIMLVSMLLVVSLMPIIYAKEFGMSRRLFAILFSLLGFGIVVAQVLNHRIIKTIGVQSATVASAWVALLAALSIVGFALMGLLNIYSCSVLVTIFTMGYVCVSSNAISIVLASHGEISGFTSSLQGALSQMFAGVAAWLISRVVLDRLVFWALALVGITSLVLLILHYHKKPFAIA